MIKRIKCFFNGHEWDKVKNIYYNRYYRDGGIKLITKNCLKCGKEEWVWGAPYNKMDMIK